LRDMSGDKEMSEVEKLKAKRRAENAAKRAAAGETVEEPQTHSEVPQNTVVEEVGAVAQISAAEEKARKVMVEIEEVTALVAAAADAEALDAVAKRQVAVVGVLGQLQAMMDEIDVGSIEDEEARTAARMRRKAINKRCLLASSGDVEVDGDIAAASHALKKAVVAARSKLS